MKFYPLEFETAMEKDALYCLEIGYADLTAATNTQTLSPINIDANQGFYVTSAELVTPFVSSDSTLKSTAITIGDSGSANRFLASMECNTANTPVYMQPGALANTSEPYLYTAAAAVTAAVTATAGKALSTHTAGLLRVFCTIQKVHIPGTPQPAVYPSL
jgi:hypothetical protein